MRTQTRRGPAALAAGFSLLLALPLAAQSADDLAGSWTFEQETPRGTMVHTLTFVLEDGTWVGTMATERRSFDLEDVAFEDGRLSFSFEAGPPPGRGGRAGGGPGGGGQGQRGQGPPQGGGSDGGTQLRTFEGVLDGDAITGEMEGPRGGMALVMSRKAG